MYSLSLNDFFFLNSHKFTGMLQPSDELSRQKHEGPRRAQYPGLKPANQQKYITDLCLHKYD